MAIPLRVLILEDSPTDAEVMVHHLRAAGYAPEWRRVETEADYLASLEPTLDLILADYTLPDFTARGALQPVRARGWDIPVIIVTGTVGEEIALECLRLGASDYLLKDRLVRLGPAVRQALAQTALRTERHRAETALAARTSQLEALRVTSEEITRELDLTALLELITQRAVDLVGAGEGTMRLWDEAEQTLVPKAWTGSSIQRAVPPLRLGEGVAGTAAERREGLIVNDFLSSAYAVPLITSNSSHTAVLAEPLLYRHRLVGVITIDRDAHMRPFTEEDRKLISLFAAPAAVAIENARLYKAAMQRGAELEALLRATRSIMSGVDLQGILDRILTEAAGMAGTPHVRIALLDGPARVLRVARVNGGLVPAGIDFPLESLSGLVVSSGEPVFSPETRIDPRSYFGQRYQELGIVTYLGLPIKSRGEVVGVLIFNTTDPRAYTAEEMAYLTSFADQAAIALENARLYQQTQEHASSLESRVEQRTAELAHANRRLQEASQHKSEFLANMSHELRTPLNSILGFAQLILEQTGALLSAKQTRFLTNIYTSGQHLLQLINDILDLSKVEAGKFILQPEALPVAATMEDILVIARGLANKKSQRIEATIAPDLPPLHADPVRFKQILFNLLSNAVKFTPAGGTITVRAARVPRDCRLPIADFRLKEPGDPNPELQIANRQSEMLEIAVTDTGLGIRAEDFPKLFREFTQLETTRAQQHEGSGLGLALTKRLVELHGGRIWAASEGEGRGSTFTVVLPFARPGT